MTWRWEEMTAPDFARAVETCGGVCLVPLGVIEKHGNHLPLGTDMFCTHRVAELAAEREPAVIFPPYYFTQIPEARHCPGTIAIKDRLMYDLLENACDEIGRNGLTKIILVNGHGGNDHWLPHFTRTLMLEQRKPYVLYLLGLHHYCSAADGALCKKQFPDVDEGGHAGGHETSEMMNIRPDTVRLEAAGEPGLPLKRLAHLPPVCTAMDWYADYPDHYAGDGRKYDRKAGAMLMDMQAKRIAAVIKAVRLDTEVGRLTAEFHDRAESVGRSAPL